MNHLTTTATERIAVTYWSCNFSGEKEQVPILISAHLLSNLGFFCLPSNLEKEHGLPRKIPVGLKL